MSRIPVCVFAFCQTLYILWIPSTQSATDRSWFPARVGVSWTYQYEVREAVGGLGIENPSTRLWITRESVKSVTAVALGTLVTIDVQPVETNRAEPVEEDYRATRHYLLSGGCLYLLDGFGKSPNVDRPLDANGALRQAFVKDVTDRAVPPDVCSPLSVDSEWGRTRHTSPSNEDVWRVTGYDFDPDAPNRERVFHLSAYESSGTMSDRWYLNGVGIIRQVTRHRGTYFEKSRRLLQFRDIS
jgi:hypothetical protein